jgi:hypothetical protein
MAAIRRGLTDADGVSLLISWRWVSDIPSSMLKKKLGPKADSRGPLPHVRCQAGENWSSPVVSSQIRYLTGFPPPHLSGVLSCPFENCIHNSALCNLMNGTKMGGNEHNGIAGQSRVVGGKGKTGIGPAERDDN